MNLNEEDLIHLILDDALLNAAYKLGQAHGYESGYTDGSVETEDWFRENGVL